MDETAENLVKVMQEFQWPDPPQQVYRLYHDDKGYPLVYTMEQLDGEFVEISKEDFFLSSMSCRVINGCVVHPRTDISVKLRPGSTGTPCSIADITVIVDPQQSHVKWSISNRA